MSGLVATSLHEVCYREIRGKKKKKNIQISRKKKTPTLFALPFWQLEKKALAFSLCGDKPKATGCVKIKGPLSKCSLRLVESRHE